MTWEVVAVFLTLGLSGFGVTWWEIRSLRSSRHDHENKLTALTITVEAVQRDVTEVRGDVRVIRDGLIAAQIIKPEEL